MDSVEQGKHFCMFHQSHNNKTIFLSKLPHAYSSLFQACCTYSQTPTTKNLRSPPSEPPLPRCQMLCPKRICFCVFVHYPWNDLLCGPRERICTHFSDVNLNLWPPSAVHSELCASNPLHSLSMYKQICVWCTNIDVSYLLIMNPNMLEWSALFRMRHMMWSPIWLTIARQKKTENPLYVCNCDEEIKDIRIAPWNKKKTLLLHIPFAYRSNVAAALFLVLLTNMLDKTQFLSLAIFSANWRLPKTRKWVRFDLFASMCLRDGDRL